MLKTHQEDLVILFLSLRDHYEDGNATEEEAKEYFSIMPMNSDEKLVKFAG